MENFEYFGKPPITNYNKMNSKVPITFRDYHDSDYDSEEEADKIAIAKMKEETAAEKVKHNEDIINATEGINSVLLRHNINGKKILTRNPPQTTTYIKKGPFTSNPFNKDPNKIQRKPKSVENNTGDAIISINARRGLANKEGLLIYDPMSPTGYGNGGRRRKRHTRRSRKTKSKRRKTRRQR